MKQSRRHKANTKYLFCTVVCLLSAHGMDQFYPHLKVLAKPELAALLNYFSIPGQDRSITLQAITQAIHRGFNINTTSYDHTLSKPLLKPYFEKLELIQELPPLHTQYQYIVAVGDYRQNTQKILQHLATIIQLNVQCEHIVLLSSDRLLEPFEKIDICNEHSLQTEADMVKHMYRSLMSTHSLLIEIPNHLVIATNTNKLIATNYPLIAKKIGCWIHKTKPLPGKCLLISEQPYAHLKKKIMQLHVPNSFEVDVTAAQAENNMPVQTFLNAVACHIQFDMNHPNNSNALFQISL